MMHKQIRKRLLLASIIMLLLLLVWGISSLKWMQQVEEPNTEEDYASREESRYKEGERDKFIYVGRIDKWLGRKRTYVFICTASGEEYRCETTELLPIRMEEGDFVMIDYESLESFGGDFGCVYEGYYLIYIQINQIRFADEEAYVSSIPEIRRVDQDYVYQEVSRKQEGINPTDEMVEWPYDKVYYYYETTGETVAIFRDNMNGRWHRDSVGALYMDETEVRYNIKRNGKLYRYDYDPWYDIRDKNGELRYTYSYYAKRSAGKIDNETWKYRQDEEVFLRCIFKY